MRSMFYSVVCGSAFLLVACSGFEGGPMGDGAPEDAAGRAPDGSGSAPERNGAQDPSDHGSDDHSSNGGVTSVQPAHLQVLLTDAPGDFQNVPITIDSVEAYLEVPFVPDPPSGQGGAGGGTGGDAVGDGGAGGAETTPDVPSPGWVTLVDAPATYDLLTLQAGVAAALGSAPIYPGVYTQIRLIVSSAQVVVDDEIHDLTIPSGENTGLKLHYDFDLSSSTSYAITLDFDAHESIKKAGPKFILTPVINVQSFDEVAPE